MPRLAWSFGEESVESVEEVFEGLFELVAGVVFGQLCFERAPLCERLDESGGCAVQSRTGPTNRPATWAAAGTPGPAELSVSAAGDATRPRP
jgi:hypothetical protein